VASGSERSERSEGRLALRRRFHPESEYGGFTDLDGAIMFYARVRELLPVDGVALDIGCGRGTQDEDPVGVRRDLRILRGHCRRVIGIDVDPVAAENSFIDEFRPIEQARPWPIQRASVDLALADFVLEHIADPDAFFGEAARVIKPSGALCIRTINAHSYLGVASRLVPSRLHAATLRRAQPERSSADVFPTVYRCNTRKRLVRALDGHGFDAAVYTSEDEPAYLTFSPHAYRLGLLHRRLAPRAFLIGLLAFARRRAEDRPYA
jgi:SAM-dependent methyltransferase